MQGSNLGGHHKENRAHMLCLKWASQLWPRGPKFLDLLFQQQLHIQIFWGETPSLKIFQLFKISSYDCAGLIHSQFATPGLNFNAILSKPFQI